jgi:murein DD-endopeptidase MepM/ murein hydrolase activator NlpD
MKMSSFVFGISLLISTATAHAVCTAPTVAGSCCNYTFWDGQNSKNVNYHGPLTVFGNEADARTWAKGVVAKMPFYLPFEPVVGDPGQGWFYDGGDSHGAVDYSRATVTAGKDVTFQVRAIAEGRVVSKLWDNWHGNVVVIEHTASDGSKYRSQYFHLRDGYTHDRNAAKAIVPANPDSNDGEAKYARYAKNNSDKLYWGQESHTIKVNVGDWVQAGQFIAQSGNTGPGGASAGLNNDGTVSDTTRANNHLHFMLSVPSPKTAGEWVYVDPYGVYAKANTGCYAIMKDLDFPRFFAPYYPSFHNIDWALYTFYFNYYPNMNWGPQTLSVYHSGNSVKAAGAFHPSVTGSWAVRGYLTTAEFNQWFTTYDRQGLRPREIQVQMGFDGQPRFTAIWQKRGNEGYAAWINMSDADMAAKWTEYITKNGYRIEDHVSYTIGGQRRHAAIYVKDNQGFQLWYNMSPAEYSAKFNQLGAAGWRNTSFNAAALPWGEKYGGVWMQKPGGWATWFNMTGQDYQQKYEEYTSQGFRLWKIQGYGNGSRFGAIWTK